MLDKIMYVANRFILLYTQSHRQRETHTHTYTCLHVHTAHAHFLDWRSNYAPQRGIWMGIFLPQFLWMGSHVCAIIMPHITFFSDWSSTHPLLFLLANLLSCTVSSFFFLFQGGGWALKYMLSDLIHILSADLHKLHWLKNCLFDDKINWKVMHFHRESTILLYSHHPSLELTWLQLCKCIPSALCNLWNKWYQIMR